MLIRYSPLRSLARRNVFLPTFWREGLFDDMWKSLGDFNIEEPKIEWKENEKNYLLRAEFPGYDKDEIKAEVEDGVLTLQAEHKNETWDLDVDEGWRSIETRRGSYRRSFALPEDVDAEQIKAAMKKGVLRLTLPRTPVKEKETKEIQIH